MLWLERKSCQEVCQGVCQGACLTCPSACGAGAVTLAGLPRPGASGHVDRGESVVCVVTGSGFKDFERIAEMVRIPERVISSYDEMVAVAAALA